MFHLASGVTVICFFEQNKPFLCSFVKIIKFSVMYYDVKTWRERAGGPWKHVPCRGSEDRSTFDGHAEPVKAHFSASTVVCKQPLRDSQAG